MDVEMPQLFRMGENETFIPAAGLVIVADVKGKAEVFRFQQEVDGLLLKGKEAGGIFDAGKEGSRCMVMSGMSSSRAISAAKR